MRQKKQPAKPDDELTAQLRMAARKKRPWTLQGILLALAFILVPAGLFIWFIYPRPDPPALQVTAFDELVAPGEKANLRAQLLPADNAAQGTRLDGRQLLFEQAVPLPKPGQEIPRTKALTESNGLAHASLELDGQSPFVPFVVRYVSEKKGFGSEHRGTVFFRPAQTRLLLVDIVPALTAAGPEIWKTTNILDIRAALGAGPALLSATEKKFQAVYLALSADPAMPYRKLRGWIENRFAGQFPHGPVLGRRAFGSDKEIADVRREILQDLAKRFKGPHVAVIAQAELVADYQQAGFKALVLGNANKEAWAKVVEDLK